MHAMLLAEAPGVPVIDLLALAPRFAPMPAGYLLAAVADFMPAHTAFVAVVDPGVGGDRAALAVRTDRHWLVGPDNGLLAIVARRARECAVWQVGWRPPRLSDSFHGRDLFAPLAARIARGEALASRPMELRAMQGSDWPEDLAEIIFVDHYGNCFTGVRAATLGRDRVIRVGHRSLRFARTFSAVGQGQAFWYANSNGLVELAVNGDNAAKVLGLGPGDPVRIEDP
jgi:S-adenosylmethionine hydrolase